MKRVLLAALMLMVLSGCYTTLKISGQEVRKANECLQCHYGYDFQENTYSYIFFSPFYTYHSRFGYYGYTDYSFGHYYYYPNRTTIIVDRNYRYQYRNREYRERKRRNIGRRSGYRHNQPERYEPRRATRGRGRVGYRTGRDRRVERRGSTRTKATGRNTRDRNDRVRNRGGRSASSTRGTSGRSSGRSSERSDQDSRGNGNN